MSIWNGLISAARRRAAPAVDPTVLTTLASACRDHERLRFDYRSHDGTSTIRSVEPHRLVSWGRKWYLVAWDIERGDADFTVSEPPELLARLQVLADRYRRACGTTAA